MTMQESSGRRSRWRGWTPRFSLRTLLIAVLLTAVAIPLGQLGWRHYVRYREGRLYATLQSAKTWQIGSDGSFSIDDGRGIPDDFAILVRRGDTFGCFFPRDQFKKGESVAYDWYYRTDGLGRFDADDPQVRSGHGFAGPYVSGSGQSLEIAFGPFRIQWSGNERGWGYLYYDSNLQPPDRAADVVRICSTDVKSLSLIDARDPRWRFKAGRRDPGIGGDEDAAGPATTNAE